MGMDQQGRVSLEAIRASFEASLEVKQATLSACGPAIVAAAERLIDCLESGGRILAFGNGGSASDAQHFCAELAGRYLRERRALPALALTANTSDLTAIGNDYGYDQVFARLVEAHGAPGDVVVAISTSGESPNVLAAVEVARERGLGTIGLMGRGGGKLAGRVDVPIVAVSDVTARIQETHIAVLHVLCEQIDEVLFPDSA